MQYVQLRNTQLPHPGLYIFFFFFKTTSTYEPHNDYFKFPKSHNNSKTLYSIVYNGILKCDPMSYASVIYIS